MVLSSQKINVEAFIRARAAGCELKKNILDGINPKHLATARESFAKSFIDGERAFVLVDKSFLTNGSAGLLLTDRAIYSSKLGENAVSLTAVTPVGCAVNYDPGKAAGVALITTAVVAGGIVGGLASRLVAGGMSGNKSVNVSIIMGGLSLVRVTMQIADFLIPAIETAAYARQQDELSSGTWKPAPKTLADVPLLFVREAADLAEKNDTMNIAEALQARGLKTGVAWQAAEYMRNLALRNPRAVAYNREALMQGWISGINETLRDSV